MRVAAGVRGTYRRCSDGGAAPDSARQHTYLPAHPILSRVHAHGAVAARRADFASVAWPCAQQPPQARGGRRRGCLATPRPPLALYVLRVVCTRLSFTPPPLQTSPSPCSRQDEQFCHTPVVPTLVGSSAVAFNPVAAQQLLCLRVMLLRGELFKSGEGSSAYKLRWFELLGRELRWAESEGTPVKGSIDLRGARVYLDLEEQLGNDDRFGMRIVPRAGPRVYALQASSAEERRYGYAGGMQSSYFSERISFWGQGSQDQNIYPLLLYFFPGRRRLWVEAIDLAAQPDLARSSASSRRHVQLKKPALNEPVGIEVTCKSGVPCVVVDVVSGKAAVEAGLLAGDIIVTIGDTVARSAALAWCALHWCPNYAFLTSLLRACAWRRMSQKAAFK
eukprot:6199279-Pleurochrysis_carterae.AAC.3